MTWSNGWLPSPGVMAKWGCGGSYSGYSQWAAGLICQSAAFEKEKEVSGFFELKVYVETNVKDLDIMATVYEIKANGSVVLLTTATTRARYRDDLEKENLLEPGAIHLFHFNHFPFISRVIEKGSRLCLLIHSPNSVYVQKNYCSGGNIGAETARDAITARIRIHSDEKHPSVLLVPAAHD
ncbi:MAG: CocE/NonD family hydrolase C-terminal non-catalytic domain-containing protein [Ferruginibacter sp.]